MGDLIRLPIGRRALDPISIWRQFETLKGERSVFEAHCQEVKDRVWPHGEDFLTKRTAGDKRAGKMLDATAALALEKFSAVLESLLTPRQQRWHRLVPSDKKLKDDPEVKAWLELATDRLFAARAAPRSGYYAQKHEGYKSLGAFGNEVLFSEAHPLGGIRYRHCPIANTYVALDPFGMLDTVYYRYEQTAKQAFQTWGEKTPKKVQETLERDPFRKHEYLHCVRPHKWVDPNALGPRSMPWESIYLCADEKDHVIEHGGYRRMPFQFSRYTVNPSEVYGRSPAMLVLGNIKLLQEQKATHLRMGHKLVDPPLLLHDEGVLGGGQAVKLKAGGMNYGAVTADGRPKILPLFTGGRLDLSFEMMQAEREIIHDALLVRLFQVLIEVPHVQTATEVLVRAEEKGVLLAPAVGRQQSEMLGPQVDRDLQILQESGELPPAPPQLRSYEIEYESPATQYQKASKLTAITRTMEVIAPLVMADPGLLLKFKGEEIVDAAADALGVPAELIRTDEEYAEIRAAYDRQQQAQQAVQMGQGVASAAKDMASAAPEGGAVAQAA